MSASSPMDVVRQRSGRRAGRIAGAAGALLLVLAAASAWFVLARGTSGSTAIDKNTIVTDVVRRGSLVRSISAAGTVAAQYVRVVAAPQAGTLDAVFVKPGTHVEDGTPVARLSNPDLESDLVGARSAVDVAAASLKSAEEEAHASALEQRSAVTTAQAQAEEDTTKLSSLEELHRSGYIAEQTYRIADIEASRSSAQLQVARASVGVDAAAQDAKVAAAQAQLRQAQAQLDAKQAQVDALEIHARSSGVVQSVALDAGAHVDAGTEIARVADQHELKAVLAVPEGQVHDVAVGMPARIDADGASITGRVERIAPAAQNGTVAVDVTLPSDVPGSLRPDANLDATIDLETLYDVLSIARPAGAADDATLPLYVLGADGTTASLVRVRVGRGSADRVAVLSGLKAGETVIVSDTSSYGGASVVRLR